MQASVARVLNNLRPALVGMMMAALVVVQALSLHHHAEHLFSAHKHHGHACVVAEYCEHFSLSDAVPVPQLPTVLLPMDMPAATPFRSVESTAVPSAFPRAPPVFA